MAKILQFYRQRVVNECNELYTKLCDLRAFTYTEKFRALTQEEQVRMKLQLFYMQGYHDVLQERINAFE